MKSLDFLIYRARYTAEILGPASLLLLSMIVLYSGALMPETMPETFSSSNELLGQVLLLILVPAFLLTYLVVAQRRSIRFAEKLVASQIIAADPADWMQKIAGRTVLLGAVIGLLYGALFNLPPEWRSSFSSLSIQIQSIAIGQVFLWTLIGLVLTYRLHTAWCFYKKGKTVRVDLYDTGKYEPFARNGLDDVLGITVLLVLATVQSLDAEFRLYNYLTAWIVAFPAAATLLILPMLSLQRRLLAHKKEFLEEMHRQVSDASRAVEPDSLAQLELLMQHRDRVRHASAWPIDLSIASRLMLYIIIPPIAWLGAAFVEVGIDRILGGP
ncbi:MAG: hypothetical protein ACE5KS_04250 [Woeseiaceae bacterium]